MHACIRQDTCVRRTAMLVVPEDAPARVAERVPVASVTEGSPSPDPVTCCCRGEICGSGVRDTSRSCRRLDEARGAPADGAMTRLGSAAPDQAHCRSDRSQNIRYGPNWIENTTSFDLSEVVLVDFLAVLRAVWVLSEQPANAGLFGD